MSFSLEYHVFVRHFFLASLVVGSLVAAVLSPSAFAQINGAPSSVTSPGFGGRAVNGTRASVTSLGPNGYTPGPRFGSSVPPERSDKGHYYRHHYVPYVPSVAYAVPLPYAVDIGDTDDYADQENYQGGPTIFDRRGSGEGSYVPPVRDVQSRSAERTDDETPATSDSPQEPTLLVFKDGHTLEVGNYAIVGAILFDLTAGHTRRIALADLDLEATRKQNDNRGVIFQLPTPPRAN